MTGKSWCAVAVFCVASACGRHPPDNVLPETQARAAAVAQLPGAAVRSHELEREDGRWVYSYDLEVTGREGVEEVLIDALTGKVVGREHETPEQERLEAEEGEQDDAGTAAAGSAAIPAPATTPKAH